MPAAQTVVNYLQTHQIPYTILPHRRTVSSRETAEAAHVSVEQLAKAVIFWDPAGYLMAVVPGDRHVGVETLSGKVGRKLMLADESRIAPVFRDCDPGAIPPIGPAYGMETIIDDSLVGLPEIYFEAGDHEDLIRVDGEQFLRMLNPAQHGQFSH
jgi:Ala-tRNA(Pro) deacylase